MNIRRCYILFNNWFRSWFYSMFKKKLLPGQKRCLRCRHIWYTRRAGRPGECPKCGSTKWDQPRTDNELGRKPKRT